MTTTTQDVRDDLAAIFNDTFPGVQVWLGGHGDVDNDNVITIDSLRVPASQQRRGIGTQIMMAICEAADHKGITLACTPSTDFGSSMAGLVRFYRHFGFRPNRGRAIDLSISESMIRLPR